MAPTNEGPDMKYMILTYASQQDYEGMVGNATDTPAWSPEEFAAMCVGDRLQIDTQDRFAQGLAHDDRDTRLGRHGVGGLHRG